MVADAGLEGRATLHRQSAAVADRHACLPEDLRGRARVPLRSPRAADRCAAPRSLYRGALRREAGSERRGRRIGGGLDRGVQEETRRNRRGEVRLTAQNAESGEDRSPRSQRSLRTITWLEP